MFKRCTSTLITMISTVITQAIFLCLLTHFVNAIIPRVWLTRYDVVTILRSSGSIFSNTRVIFQLITLGILEGVKNCMSREAGKVTFVFPCWTWWLAYSLALLMSFAVILGVM